MRRCMKQLRQGDVLVEEVVMRRRHGARMSHLILAEGETTGHRHTVIADATANPGTDQRAEPMPPAQLFTEPDGTRYLFVDRACLLVHPEHDPLSLAPGCYRVVQQREYTAAAGRSVQD